MIVVMGVSGSGKTSVGSALARALSWEFLDGDDYHSVANREKMGRGLPLTDADRTPWLDQLRGFISASLADGKSIVLACSALKQSYRDRLKAGDERIKFVYLKGDFALIKIRMAGRADHFMKAGMLESQFEILEEPRDALVVDINKSVDEIVAEILKKQFCPNC